MIKNQPVSIEQVIYKQAHESAKQRKGRENACHCIRSSDTTMSTMLSLSDVDV